MRRELTFKKKETAKLRQKLPRARYKVFFDIQFRNFVVKDGKGSIVDEFETGVPFNVEMFLKRRNRTRCEGPLLIRNRLLEARGQREEKLEMDRDELAKHVGHEVVTYTASDDSATVFGVQFKGKGQRSVVHPGGLKGGGHDRE
jgi:hypothetical protein